MTAKTPAMEAAYLADPCCLCARRCGAHRHKGERGVCGLGDKARTLKLFVNYGEEPWIGTSLMVYFSGCNMRCAYCSVPEGFQESPPGSEEADAGSIAALADKLFREGKIVSVQFLGGEPVCNLPAALEIAVRCTSKVRKIWNSNFTFSPEAFALLEPVMDGYAADLKFGCDGCALALADFPGYMACVLENLRRVKPGKLLIRHLALHGHWECCTKPVIELLKREFPHVPAGFHPLIPDAAGRTAPLSGEETERLDRETSGLRRVYAGLPRQDAVSAPGRFESEIVIGRDGRIRVQDVSSPVARLLQKVST